MKPALLSQLMAAPLASLFLILTFFVVKMGQSHATGESLFETYVDSAYSIACSGDGHSYYFNLHNNQTANVDRRNLPLQEAYGYVEDAMAHRVARAVFFSADPDTSFAEVAQAMDHLKNRSPGLLFFRCSSSEKRHFDDPRNNFDCVVPKNLSSILGPPPVRSYFPPVEYQ